MASYKLFFDRDVEKDLAKIPKQDVRKIMVRTLKLSSSPHPPQSLKLAGSESMYRLRIGNYRVIYQIDISLKEIIVYHIRHRKDIYR